MPPSPTSNQLELSWRQGAISRIRETTFRTDPLADAAYPQISPRSRRGYWNHQMRRWILKPSFRVFIILIVVSGISFYPALLSASKNSLALIAADSSWKSNGVRSSYPTDRDRAVDQYFQLRLVGTIYRFDWLDPSKVSVTWSVSGCGNYSSATVWDCTMVNTAVDIYLDEWVQI